MTLEEIHTLARIKAPKIGLLGGTFDPVHAGHIVMSEIAIEQYGLDQVWLLVSGNPPHKPTVTDAELRFEMAELACRNHRKVEASRFEIDREGTTYSIETLEALIPLLPPDTELYYIIGTDTLYELESWKRYRDVLTKVSFIVIPREGYSPVESFAFSLTLSATERARMSTAGKAAPNISSTQIRKRVAQGLEIDHLVDSAVANEIHAHNLYRHAALRFEEVQNKLSYELHSSTYQHTLGVIDTAERLANAHGVSPIKARWAALLHDCAKNEAKRPLNELFSTYALHGIPEYEFAPQLIHAPLGVLIARGKYGMEDGEILAAIARHTTGDTEMSDLDKVIYLADAMEPRRSYPGVELLREAAWQDLDKAMLIGLNQSIEHVVHQGHYLDELSIRTRNLFWKRWFQRENTPPEDELTGEK